MLFSAANFKRSIFLFSVSLVLTTAFTLSCSAFPVQQSEEEALKSLRLATKNGKLPPEALVIGIESRFSKTRTGALAKLLRARIHFENKNFGAAAAILDNDVFRRLTTVADYALWLRGKSLQEAGKPAESVSVFSELIRDFPNSLRTREAKLLRASIILDSQPESIKEVPEQLKDLNQKNDPDSLLLTAQAFGKIGENEKAVETYRKVYFFGAGSNASIQAENSLKTLGQDLNPRTAEEIKLRADRLAKTGKASEAAEAFVVLLARFPEERSPEIDLKRLNNFASLGRLSDARSAFDGIPTGAKEKPEAFYKLALAYANGNQWDAARTLVKQMQEVFPTNDLTPKTLVDVGNTAREKRNRAEETYYLKTAVIMYPRSIDVAGAQFGLAWLAHESGDVQNSSQMLVEHLARYVDKDNSNRGQAGYWAARDSEKAGKMDDACALYDAMLHRYGANWYGYLSLNRLTNLRRIGKCQTTPNFSANSLIPRAVENLKVVTVAPETATEKELARAENSDELSTIGLFDWAIEELEAAKKTAKNSPKINLALARHYRLKSDNVRALLALKESYPDYYAMTPEEMGQEEWDIFYPLTHWNEIKLWGEKRNLDPYEIAGFIRQETIFNPTAKSSANAYGLMQLLIPTARTMARKYSDYTGTIDSNALFDPALNIELGTAYMREQYDKYGRTEFVAVAYNAGPGRVVQWQRSLPFEMDEFVEAIPFRETKGYVQGIIRNSAQYRRLYDLNGAFKSNVGSRPIRAAIDSMPRDQFAKAFPDVQIDSSGE